MSSNTNQRTFALVIILLAVLALFVIFSTKKTDAEADTPEEAVTAVASEAIVAAPSPVSSVAAEAVVVQPVERKSDQLPQLTAESQANLLQLQDFLDDDEQHDKALELALKMAHSGNRYERLAALNAFEWLGGEESVKACIKLLDEINSVGTRASQVLTHLIQENLFTEKPLFTTDMWQSLFGNLHTEEEVFNYMLLLSSYPAKQSFPVFLELMNSENTLVPESALEYMGSVAGGEEFKSVEEARKWYEANLVRRPAENQ